MFQRLKQRVFRLKRNGPVVFEPPQRGLKPWIDQCGNWEVVGDVISPDDSAKENISSALC